MTQVIEATFDGEVFRPTGTVQLPANTRVQLLVRAESEKAPVSFLDVAAGLKLEGPSDWSVRINDYLISDTPND
jgi:predicted DNA-binding antitoxin AbrB/MazE fold protein